MRGKIQLGPVARRLPALGGLALASLAWAGQPALVSGRVTMLDKDDQSSDDVGQAVVWLSGPPSQARPPVQAEIGTSKKEFSPHVLVVPVGSTVAFPNHDPFNHNVFSLSEENPFDLGLYSKEQTKLLKFDQAGPVEIFCSIHPRMNGVILVLQNPFFTKPAADGSFTLPNVPAGEWKLRVYRPGLVHEPVTVKVPAKGTVQLEP